MRLKGQTTCLSTVWSQVSVTPTVPVDPPTQPSAQSSACPDFNKDGIINLTDSNLFVNLIMQTLQNKEKLEDMVKNIDKIAIDSAKEIIAKGVIDLII